MTSDRSRRLKLVLLKAAYIGMMVFIGLVLMEAAARMLGLGNPILYYTDVWGGVRPLPNQHVTRLGGAAITVDSNSFRTPVKEQPGALRVMFLGDSVTWGGSRIDDKQLYTEVAADVLRAEKRPVYAMNAGVNATALINHAERFQKQGEDLDALVWIFPWGDTNRNYATSGVLSPPRYKPELALVEVLDFLIVQYWANWFRNVPQNAEDFVSPDRPAGGEEIYERMLAERLERNLDAARSAVAEAKRRGVPIILGISPYLESGKVAPLPPAATSFLEEMAAEGVNVFDVSESLTEGGPDVADCYIDKVHFSAEGHRRVGEALGKKLQEVIAPPQS